MQLVTQRAEADVKSLGSMPEADPATTSVAEGASSELPACRLRRVTQYVQENLQRELRLAELSVERPRARVGAAREHHGASPSVRRRRVRQTARSAARAGSPSSGC